MVLSTAKQHSPIAIDVGSANLHVAQLQRREGNVAVHAWCDLSLEPKGSGKEHTQAEPAPGRWPDLDRNRFLGNEVVVALNPPEVECAPLRVPENLLKLDHRTLLAAIRHEVSRTISLPIDGVEMDVWPLMSGHLDSPNLMVAAARREVIATLLNWLDQQKLICRRIDVGPLAALRACARLANAPANDQLWGVLDIGKAAVRLYIGIGAIPIYVRCIPKGGEEMTRRISEELGIDRAVAESYKKHYGVHGGDGHYRSDAAVDDAVDSRRMAGILLGALRPMIRGMGEEIQRSFRYAMGLYPDRPIAGLWVIGGGGELAGLPEIMSELLGVPVQRVTSTLLPAAWVVPAGGADQAILRSITALGLCLGEMN